MKILIDNGHGEDTPGKRSPDGVLREYKYTREIAECVMRDLRSRGYNVERIVTEQNDVPLTERVRRANAHCAAMGASNVVLVSIHCNAAGMGNEWVYARGWCAYTSRGTTKSDDLANMLYEEAGRNFAGRTLRKDLSDGDPDWEAGFYILKNTKCPAVLTENFFMDNKADLSYLLSAEGREQIIKTHVNAIIAYVKKYGKI